MRFCCIAGALERPIAGVQHCSVWLGLYRGTTTHQHSRQYRLIASCGQAFCPRLEMFVGFGTLVPGVLWLGIQTSPIGCVMHLRWYPSSLPRGSNKGLRPGVAMSDGEFRKYTSHFILLLTIKHDTMLSSDTAIIH